MLLLLPFDRELDWRRAPVVVIALILINSLIFFFGQGNDDRNVAAALAYYHESDLWRIELPAYRNLLEQKNASVLSDFDSMVRLDKSGTISDYHPGLPFELEFDPDFQHALPTLVPRESPDYASWHEKRAQFEKLLSASITHSYSLRPALALARPITLVSHMFLHANIGHLAGNMLFLFVVGFVVEATLGSAMFLFVYLCAGLGSGGMDLIVHADDFGYSLGASGAISGIMAAYAVLFGTRRIHFFYNFLIWFDRIRAPAIIMLPLWLANEALQLVLNPGSHVNYWAHISGMLVGAFLTGGLRLLNRGVDQEYLDRPEKEAALARARDEGLKRLGELRFSEARQIFSRLARENPDRLDLVEHLRAASQSEPESDSYHDSSRRLLLAAAISTELRARIFDDYVTRAKPKPRLSLEESLNLARLLVDEGSIVPAEKLTLALMRRVPRHPQLLPIIKRLAQRLPPERAETYRRMIAQLVANP